MRFGRTQAPPVHAEVEERLRRLAAGWAPTPALPFESESQAEPIAPLRTQHWSKRSWRGFLLLLSAIAVAGGWLWWQGQPREVTAIPGTSAESGFTQQAAVGDVTVHVAGAVRKPGLVTLPAGSRVAEAIDKAGGARSLRALESVNLARVLVDGEQLIVGQTAGENAAGGKLSLSTATAAELEQLPGVGPVLAQRIVQWRTDQGPFRSIDDVNEVSGVGDALMEQIRPLVVK